MCLKQGLCPSFHFRTPLSIFQIFFFKVFNCSIESCKNKSTTTTTKLCNLITNEKTFIYRRDNFTIKVFLNASGICLDMDCFKKLWYLSQQHWIWQCVSGHVLYSKFMKPQRLVFLHFICIFFLSPLQTTSHSQSPLFCFRQPLGWQSKNKNV